MGVPEVWELLDAGLQIHLIKWVMTDVVDFTRSYHDLRIQCAGSRRQSNNPLWGVARVQKGSTRLGSL